MEAVFAGTLLAATGLVVVGICCCAFLVVLCVPAVACCGFVPCLILFNKNFSTRTSTVGGHIRGQPSYSPVPQAEVVNANAYYAADGSPATNNDIVMAEAYLVPPMATQITSTASRSNSQAHVEAGISSRGQSLGEQHQPLSEYTTFKDVWAAALFITNVLVVFYYAYLQFMNPVIISDGKGSVHTPVHSVVDTTGAAATVMIWLIVYGLIAAFVGLAWISVLLRNSHAIIDFTMRGNIFFLFLLSFLSLISLQVFGAVVFGVLGLLNICYYYAVQSRIPFASSILSTAAQGIKENFTGVMACSMAMLVLQICWLVLWMFAGLAVFKAAGIIHLPVSGDVSSTDALTGGQACTIIASCLSLYWGLEVLKYSLQTVVAGVVSIWWFQPHRKFVVRGALFRTLTVSFGAICFGSLLVAAVHTLLDVIRFIRRRTSQQQRGRDRDCAAGLALCLLDCLVEAIERLLLYVNRYAFCYVAAYGFGFLESSSKVMRLLQAKGWFNTVINDSLIANSLSIVVYTSALATGLIGYLSCLANFQHISATAAAAQWPLLPEQLPLAFAAAAAVVGFVVSSLVIYLLESAVAMVYVCYAEDPDALKDNHYDIYLTMTRASMGVFTNGQHYPGSGSPPYTSAVQLQQLPIGYPGYSGSYQPSYDPYPQQYHDPAYPPPPIDRGWQQQDTHPAPSAPPLNYSSDPQLLHPTVSAVAVPTAAAVGYAPAAAPPGYDRSYAGYPPHQQSQPPYRY